MTTDSAGAYGGIGFGRGLDERQPVIVLLDTSASMNRPAHAPPIADLNRALAHGLDSIRASDRLRSRVEVCLVAFDSRVRVFDAAAGTFRPPEEAADEALFSPLDGLRTPALTAGASPAWCRPCGSPWTSPAAATGTSRPAGSRRCGRWSG